MDFSPFSFDRLEKHATTQKKKSMSKQNRREVLKILQERPQLKVSVKYIRQLLLVRDEINFVELRTTFWTDQNSQRRATTGAETELRLYDSIAETARSWRNRR